MTRWVLAIPCIILVSAFGSPFVHADLQTAVDIELYVQNSFRDAAYDVCLVRDSHGYDPSAWVVAAGIQRHFRNVGRYYGIGTPPVDRFDGPALLWVRSYMRQAVAWWNLPDDTPALMDETCPIGCI